MMEALAIGWFYKTSKVLDEINKNTVKFKMPSWWFSTSIKVIAPLVLLVFFVWNVYTLLVGGGIYGAADGYTLSSNIYGGWLLTALVLLSGFIVKIIVNIKKKNGYIEPDASWDDVE